MSPGFLDAKGVGMLRGWRLIFGAEGIITMGLAVIMYFLLPDGPAKAKFLSPPERGKHVTFSWLESQIAKLD